MGFGPLDGITKKAGYRVTDDSVTGAVEAKGDTGSSIFQGLGTVDN